MSIDTSSPINIRRAESSDIDAIRALLTASGLPVDGVRTPQPSSASERDELRIVIAESAGEVVAVAAMERHGAHALLRSVATSERWRGGGIARVLVEQLLETARADGVASVHLLTTTASAWFSRIGFEAIDREETPIEIQRSPEFASICPSTATVMRYRFPRG